MTQMRSIRTWFASASLVCLSPSVSYTQPSGEIEVTPPIQLPDGTPVEGNQFPRFIRPTHEGPFGFNNFLVLGDYPTVEFERRDVDQESGVSQETWTRIDVAEVAGRAVSVFRPMWTSEELDAGFRTQRWGVDRPTLFWGQVVVPGAGESGRQDIYLQLAPTNLPPSTVTQVSDTVQYASHAVNISVPGFGVSRIQLGDTALNLEEVTRRFYEVFADEYDTLAVVSQPALLSSHIGFRENVQNQIFGIGLPIFDVSARYGSEGVLQGVEAYPPGGWATLRATLHQQAHQWGDYSAVWNRLGITRQGDDPARHTPLVTPGSVLAGAVLEATRRVGSPIPGASEIERTLPVIEYHPITLYRMGLLPADALPEMGVFVDQGQFEPMDRTSPKVGTSVEGDQIPLFFNDFLAADGQRTGPPADRVRRAVIYVSRDGLASQEEMDVISFYAARMEAMQGITSWDQYPSFFEATGGRALMSTAITPLPVVAPDGTVDGGTDGTTDGTTEASLAVEYLDVAADALTGVLLDEPIPGRVAPGKPVNLSGKVTATDRDDFNIVCFRFIRYGSSNVNEVFVCGSMFGDRFSTEVTFTSAQRGSYTVEPFLFWPNAGGQFARSRYGVVVVD